MKGKEVSQEVIHANLTNFVNEKQREYEQLIITMNIELNTLKESIGKFYG